MKKQILFVLLFFVGIASAQLSGTFYIGATAGTRPGGGDPEYASMSAAVSALNTNGVGGPCTFYFLDASYTEAADFWLGCTGTSSTNTVTFKPYTGVSPTITFTQTTLHALTATTGLDGHFIIASPTGNNSDMVPTHYVTIDGSNTIGGTSRDLSFVGATTASQKSVIRIFGDNDNITIKNCNITTASTSGSSNGAIQVTIRFVSPTNYTPDNVTIDNNALTATAGNGSNGIYIFNSGSATTGATGLVIKNNTINGRVRGMLVAYNLSGDIYGNTITVNSQVGQAGAGIALQSNFGIAGTYNIYNNKLTSLITSGTNAALAASNGMIGIDVQNATPKITNIYNNFITGFNTTSGATNNKIYAIRHTTSGTSNVYHNTIYIPDMTDMSVFGSSLFAAVCFGSAAASEASPTGTLNLKNNIIVSDESSMKVWGIRRVGTSGTINFDYNNIKVHATGYTGMYNASDAQSLGDWQTASSQDAHSKAVATTFVSSTDLHLSGGSNGDVNFIGVTGLGISTDIDGASRSGTFPYMGADEASIALPVELTSFTAVAKGKNVELKWSTATETNNHGFDIERSVNGTWTKIGFVQGAGSSNAPKEYGYVDAVKEGGRISYRLKQIDRDGKFTYIDAIEVVITLEARSYDLAQNFPNPFNPVTTIRFSVKQLEQTSVKVYDIAGKEVAELFNGVASPGQVYNVQFNGTGLASGMYLYVLQTPTAREVRKMTLLK